MNDYKHDVVVVMESSRDPYCRLWQLSTQMDQSLLFRNFEIKLNETKKLNMIQKKFWIVKKIEIVKLAAIFNDIV